VLERCGYLQVERVGERRVNVEITDSGRGFTDDLREYLRVRVSLHVDARRYADAYQSYA